jgi:hypothetical protein
MDMGETNDPSCPRYAGGRVSITRTGSTRTNEDAGLDAAFATIRPPPPNVMAMAAPIAAQRDLQMCEPLPQSFVDDMEHPVSLTRNPVFPSEPEHTPSAVNVRGFVVAGAGSNVGGMVQEDRP